jgi:hypothetical protein
MLPFVNAVEIQMTGATGTNVRLRYARRDRIMLQQTLREESGGPWRGHRIGAGRC